MRHGAREALVHSAATFRVAERQPLSRRRILLVDDDPRLVRVVAMYLAIEGYEVVTATDAEEGLAHLEAMPFDLVILDVMMPGTDGIEACRRIKGDPRFASLPVLLFTALSRPGDIERGRLAGADRFITKPFSLIGLEGVIRSFLGDPVRA